MYCRVATILKIHDESMLNTLGTCSHKKTKCHFVTSCTHITLFIWSMLDGRIMRWLWVPVVEIK